MSLGEKILYYRKRKSWSQEKLAENLNVSRQSVSKWELNQSMPEIESIKTLSQLFEVSIDDLLNEEVATYENVNAPYENNNNFSQWIKKHFHYLGYILIIWGIFGILQLSIFAPTFSKFKTHNDSIINYSTDFNDNISSEFDQISSDIEVDGSSLSFTNQGFDDIMKTTENTMSFIVLLGFLYNIAKIIAGALILVNHKKKIT